MRSVCHDLHVPDPFADFTEGGYRQLVQQARDRFAFEPFGTASEEPHALWRHDVDISVHRALKLARIEVELGVRSTWFIMLGSGFYNLFERGILERAREIVQLGHWVGLHFDANPFTGASRESVMEDLARERSILADLLEAPVDAVSFHNPVALPLPGFEDDLLAGMRSATSPSIVNGYTYVSDSNGYWRFRSLGEVIADPDVVRLQALTHAEWWQAEAMAPRERVVASVMGRANASLAEYDALLKGAGRTNVAHAEELPDR